MPKVNGSYVNPFYQKVTDYVETELNTRASFYGRRVRGSGKGVPADLAWAYQKTAWGHVISRDYKFITLGFPGSPLMSDKDGNLTLYSAKRNVPRKPLLTSIEVSNEGTIGSLMKGKFTFTVFPALTSNGFDLGSLEQAFFVPGREVELSWGWSVAAADRRACNMSFTGIVYNFDWSFNMDMSVTANVSIVSAASIAMGSSGDQSVLKKEEPTPPPDPAGLPMTGDNLIKVIDMDLSVLSKKYSFTKGQQQYISPNDTKTLNGSGKLDYWAIGLPFQESSEKDDKGNFKNPPVEKTFWYVKLGSIVEFANTLISGSGFQNVYTVAAFGNETEYNPQIKSAFPIDVYFPDEEMGSYGDFRPFGSKDQTAIRAGVTPGTINIGQILLGTDYVKATYKKFVEENSTNIPFRNLTNFFNELVKRINMASGDVYQLTAQMYEQSIGGRNTVDSSPDNIKPAILSLEDSNLAKAHTNFSPYTFEGNIHKPLIKNIQLSSKPPGPLASAAYTQARSGKIKPDNNDVQVALKSDKSDEFTLEYGKTLTDIEEDLKNAAKAGFNPAWSEGYRGKLVKVKKLKIEADGKGGAHWLNKAIYPIDLTLTIDGIAGFKFGDVIRTTLIPVNYNTLYKMVFTVTKISHSIKDGVWETTLNTKARISMD